MEHLKKTYGPPIMGIQNRLSPIMCNDKEAPVLENWEVNQTGLLEKCKGYRKDSSPFPATTDSYIRMLLNLRRGSTYDALLVSAADAANTNASFKVDTKVTLGEGTYSYIGHVSDVPNIPSNAYCDFINTNTGVTGYNTDWTKSLAPGDKIKRAGDPDSDYTEISTVNSDTSLTLVAGGYLGTSGTTSGYYIKSIAYTATFTTGNTTVTGQGTKWATQLKAGDKIKASVHTDAMYTEIATVNSNTSLTLVTGGYLGASAATATYIARVILSTAGIPVGVCINNKAVIVNGTDTPFTFDGTTVSLITSSNIPKGCYIELHKNRVFIANGYTIAWSAINDEQLWQAESMEEIFPEDGGDICAIKSFGDSLVVFKDKGTVYQVFGNLSDSAVGTVDFIKKVDLTDNIGKIFARSPVVHNGNLYFFASTGIYKMDYKGWVEKISYNIDNTTLDVTNLPGPVSAKSHPVNTTSLWNTGTYGTPVSTKVQGNSLSGICDLYTKSDVNQSNQQCAIAINAAGTIAIAYLDSTGTKIKCFMQTLGEVETTYDVATVTSTIYDISVDITTNADLVVSYYASNFGVYCAECTSGGTFGTPALVGSPQAEVTSYYSCQVKFGSDKNTIFLFWSYTGNYSGSRTFSVYISVKTGGNWLSAVSAWAYGPTVFQNFIMHRMSANVQGTKLAVAFEFQGAYGFTFSSDSGATWSSYTSITPTSYTDQGVFLGYDNANKFVMMYMDGTTFKAAQFDTANPPVATTTTIKSNCGFISGATINNGNYVYSEISAAGTNTFTYTSSANIVDNVAGRYTTANINTGKSGLVSNGAISAYIYYGANANELLTRRVSPLGEYLSAEFYDATLTAWGTYSVTNEQDNGQTVTHQIALSATAHPSLYRTVVPGAVISSNPTLTYAIFKISMVLSSFSAPTIDGVILNYTGTGVDARQLVGISFRNELYYAYSPIGASANSKCEILDIAQKFISNTYPVSCFCYYNGELYGGHSGKGDLLILKSGYSYAGVAYTADCQMKEDFLDSIELEKDIVKLYVLYKTEVAGSATISYRLDNFANESPVAWTSSTLNLAAPANQTMPGVHEILVGRKCRSIQLRIQDSTLDSQTGILGIAMTYRFLNLR